MPKCRTRECTRRVTPEPIDLIRQSDSAFYCTTCLIARREKAREKPAPVESAMDAELRRRAQSQHPVVLPSAVTRGIEIPTRIGTIMVPAAGDPPATCFICLGDISNPAGGALGVVTCCRQIFHVRCDAASRAARERPTYRCPLCKSEGCNLIPFATLGAEAAMAITTALRQNWNTRHPLGAAPAAMPPPEIRRGGEGWQEDREALDCSNCHQQFTLFKRRHHCRRCGFVISSACSVGRGEVRTCADTALCRARLAADREE